MKNIMLNLRHLVTALLATVLCSCDLYPTPIHTGEKVMSELTKTMKPICVGRLVIEIPEEAHIIGWDQEVERLKIESISPPSPNRKTFDDKVSRREMSLRHSPHDTDGVLLKSKTQLTPDSVLLVYREDKSDTTLYQLEALFWSIGVEYKLQSETTDKYLDVATARITKIAKSFIATPTTDLATLPPGLCIEHAVITGSDTEFRRESVSVAGRIDEYPGLGFSFSTYSASQASNEPSRIERLAKSFGIGDDIGNKVSSATRYLRNRKRILNGQSGEELVTIATVDGVTYMDANAEFFAEPNVLNKPHIEITLGDQTHDDNTHKPYNKNLTEKEFLALWDTMLNSIRPRTKNQTGTGSIWGPGPGKK